MKISIIFLLAFCLSGEIYSQKYSKYDNCQFEFENFKFSNPLFYNLDSIDKNVGYNIINFLKLRYDNLFPYIEFEKVQKLKEGSKIKFGNFEKYYNKRIDDEANYFYHIPNFEFIFNSHICIHVLNKVNIASKL